MTVLTSSSHVPFDIDAPVTEELKRLTYVDLHQLSDEFDGVWTRSTRANIRYLAALFPNMSLQQLAQTLFDVLDNRNINIHDLRAVLAGLQLHDTSRETREVPFASIQEVGRVLIGGGSRAAAARSARVSLDTVVAIDTFLGLSQAYDDRLLDAAIDAVRENWTVRKFSETFGVARSTAHRTLRRATGVLVELGEAPSTSYTFSLTV